MFIAYSKNNKYVIKVYQNIFHTKTMIKLHFKLIKSGINVPKIIFTKEDES